MEAVDKIRAVNTGFKKGMGDVPTETVTIVKVRAATDAEAAKFKN
jgi:hypothetical protein